MAFRQCLRNLPLVFSVLLEISKLSRGASCPDRVAFVPERTLGLPFNGQFVSNANTIAFGTPGKFEADCCPRGRIANWTVTTTQDFGWLAKVNATCTDGTQISSPLFGYNGTLRDGGPWICARNGTNPPQSVFQPDKEGVFPFDVDMGSGMRTFMGIGSISGYSSSASCPFGTRAIGIGARSSCYSLTDLKVICAKTNDTRDNLASLQRSTQCGYLDAIPAAAGTLSLGNPWAWNDTSDPKDPLYAAAAGPVQTDCCAQGQAIANWTIAPSWHVRKADGFPGGYAKDNAMGYLQGQCTDGVLLAPILYGVNGTNSSVCDQQRLDSEYHYNSPSNGEYIYNNSPSGSSKGILKSFMFPQTSNPILANSIRCQLGQQVAGYTAQSGCFSLANVKILCGNPFPYSFSSMGGPYNSFKNTLPTYAFPDGEAGVCPNTASMVPDQRNTSVTPIGRIGAWSIDKTKASTGGKGWNVSDIIYTANAGPFTSLCCEEGKAIKSFDIWPTANINKLVGKVSATCIDWLSRNLTTTPPIAFGFNGTSLDGTPQSCNATLLAPQTKSLNNQSWTYRASWSFESLMEVPVRGRDAYGTTADETSASCPQSTCPVGFGARSACWGLADFRVICGSCPSAPLRAATPDPAAVTSGTSHGASLSTGAKAGIAVGVVFAAAIVAILAGLLLYKRHRSRTHIESRMLFNLNGPAGFYTDATVTKGESSGQKSTDGLLDSAHNTPSSSALSTDLMTIGTIGKSKDDTPVSFEGIPPEWEIKSNQVRLHCIKGKPVELGRGGFGVVLWGQVHKEDAAIKLIKGHSRENDMLQEIAILERAKTNYVTRFLGYSVCPDGILLAMEYMPGGDLYTALRQSDEFQWRNRGRKAFGDICKGLYMLHSNMIAHLDMKTPNCLIAGDGTCKISDLGQGRLLTADRTNVTAEAMGTLAYLSPEHFMEGRTGFSSDIWALSTILWEICTLKPPSREAWSGDIRVPEDAPQAVVDLFCACRSENPKERPLIGTVCDIIEKINK